MDLKGKKIAFLGDSITEGCGTSGKEKIFWSLIGQRTGAFVYGYGIGGTKIAKPRVMGEDAVSDQYFGSRVDSMIPDADIVVVFGGTNDFGWGDAPLGTMDDRREDTFYGAYHLLLQKLIERYPNSHLVVMTPLHRQNEDDGLYNSQGVRRMGTLKCYVEAIRQVAEFYGVVVADMYATCPIQPRFEPMKVRYMPDGLHPNDAGHVLIAERLISTLKML